MLTVISKTLKEVVTSKMATIRQATTPAATLRRTERRRAASPKLRTSLFHEEQFKGASREIAAKLT